MKSIITLLALIALIPQSLVATEQPNIVIVFIDDMGWGDFSCFGNDDAATPHIDRLASEGVRFEQFYVNSPICSGTVRHGDGSVGVDQCRIQEPRRCGKAD